MEAMFGEDAQMNNRRNRSFFSFKNNSGITPERAFKTVMVLGLFLASACTTTPGTETPPASSGEATEITPGTPVYLSSQIMDATLASLDETLGEPALARSEGEGEFRRYSLQECVLIVILYPDEAGIVRVASVEAAPLEAGATVPDLDQCLAVG